MALDRVKDGRAADGAGPTQGRAGLASLGAARRRLGRWLVAALKLGVPAAIIAYLLWNIDQEQWRALAERPLGRAEWLMLAGAWLLTFALVCLTFVRWWLLVRAVDLPFRLRDAFRLGFLGYLLNFVSVGLVGGDLFKAVFIAREQPGRRAVAAATVLVDRVVGVGGLLVVASAALLLAELPRAGPELAAIRQLTLLAAAAGLVVLLLAFTPAFSAGRLARAAARIPWLGPILQRLFEAGAMYRAQPGLMALCLAMSAAVHVSIALVYWLIAQALFPNAPTLSEHLVIAPVANVAGALPFTPAGLGALEAAMEYLYARLPALGRADVPGVTVALTYRFITILIAMAGVVVYWTAGRELREALEEAEMSQAAG